MLEKLLLSAFITLSLYLHVGGNWLNFQKTSSLGEVLPTQPGKILLSQNLNK